MSVALLLSSRPIDFASLKEAVCVVSTTVEPVALGLAGLDEADVAGVAELMAILETDHAAFLIDRSVPVYDPGLFDQPSELRSSIVAAAVKAGLDRRSRSYFGLLYEWEGVELTRFISGPPSSLVALLEMFGGWPEFRLNRGKGGAAQETKRTLIFKAITDRESFEPG